MEPQGTKATPLQRPTLLTSTRAFATTSKVSVIISAVCFVVRKPSPRGVKGLAGAHTAGQCGSQAWSPGVLTAHLLLAPRCHPAGASHRWGWGGVTGAELPPSVSQWAFSIPRAQIDTQIKTQIS